MASDFFCVFWQTNHFSRLRSDLASFFCVFLSGQSEGKKIRRFKRATLEVMATDLRIWLVTIIFKKDLTAMEPLTPELQISMAENRHQKPQKVFANYLRFHFFKNFLTNVMKFWAKFCSLFLNLAAFWPNEDII